MHKPMMGGEMKLSPEQIDQLIEVLTAMKAPEAPEMPEMEDEMAEEYSKKAPMV